MVWGNLYDLELAPGPFFAVNPYNLAKVKIAYANYLFGIIYVYEYMHMRVLCCQYCLFMYVYVYLRYVIHNIDYV